MPSVFFMEGCYAVAGVGIAVAILVTLLLFKKRGQPIVFGFRPGRFSPSSTRSGLGVFCKILFQKGLSKRNERRLSSEGSLRFNKLMVFQPTSLSISKGILRTRMPVAAKIAFANAGATGGSPGSPTPFMSLPPPAKIWTSIVGISLIRSIGLS